MAEILFLESFYGGSHKSFADSLIEHSSHNFDLFTLPNRFWKWRMRGAALYFFETVQNPQQYDLIFCSNMTSVSDLKSLWSHLNIPIIVYFHENQILYPLSPGEKEDLHYGFTDLTTALAADSVLFNSHYHKNAFLQAIKPFLSRMPDNRPYWIHDQIKNECHVLYPGCSISDRSHLQNGLNKKPLFIWNHRWEHDKNPDDFFELLFDLDSQGLSFELAVLGEKYKNSPAIFEKAKSRLKGKIVHFGYAKTYEEYVDWLNKGDIILSTSNQENFGISVVEAISYGSFPLLPQRLSYEELIPQEFHRFCLYKNKNGLKSMLNKLISNFDIDLLKKIMVKNLRFSWEQLINEYDDHFNKCKKKSQP